MRDTLKFLIYLMLFFIIAEGAVLAFFVKDTDRLLNKRLPELEQQGDSILKMLQSYKSFENGIMSKYPVVEAKDWASLIGAAVKEAGVKTRRTAAGESRLIRGTNAVSRIYALDIIADNMESIIKAASLIEQISPALIVSSITIVNRRNDDSPISCHLDVTIYEKSSSAPPAEEPEKTPEASSRPLLPGGNAVPYSARPTTVPSPK